MPRYTRKRYRGGSAPVAPMPPMDDKKKKPGEGLGSMFSKLGKKASEAMSQLAKQGRDAAQPGIDHVKEAGHRVGHLAYKKIGDVGTTATGLAENAANSAINTSHMAANRALNSVPLPSTGGKKYYTRSKAMTRKHKVKRYRKRVGKSHCRGKMAAKCRSARGCKMAMGKKRSFCRKSKSSKLSRTTTMGGRSKKLRR